MARLRRTRGVQTPASAPKAKRRRPAPQPAGRELRALHRETTKLHAELHAASRVIEELRTKANILEERAARNGEGKTDPIVIEDDEEEKAAAAVVAAAAVLDTPTSSSVATGYCPAPTLRRSRAPQPRPSLAALRRLRHPTTHAEAPSTGRSEYDIRFWAKIMPRYSH